MEKINHELEKKRYKKFYMHMFESGMLGDIIDEESYDEYIFDSFSGLLTVAKSDTSDSGLNIPVVNERTLGINSCAALIKAVPLDQAIQTMKSDIAGQPETTVIDGQLVVAYVR